MTRAITPLEMKKFIVETLGLEEVAPESIGDDQPLFGGGLGLDSIDALELGIALKKAYNLEVSGDGKANREHFRSVNALVALVAANGS